MLVKLVADEPFSSEPHPQKSETKTDACNHWVGQFGPIRLCYVYFHMVLEYPPLSRETHTVL